MTDELGTVDRSGTWPEIRFERYFSQPVTRVWAALTDPAQLCRWLATANVDGQPGGRFELQFNLQSDSSASPGRVIAWEAERLLEFTWYPETLGDSRVRIELTASGEGCLLSLSHSFPESHGIAETMGGWHIHLEALEALLSGLPVDLRTAPWKKGTELYRDTAEALR